MDFLKLLGLEHNDFCVILGTTTFDFDANNEKSNKDKHGYSLQDAVCLFEQWILPAPSTSFITETAEQNGAIKHQHIGIDNNGTVVFIVTEMQPDETVRILSFREATETEQERFQSEAINGYLQGKGNPKNDSR